MNLMQTKNNFEFNEEVYGLSHSYLLSYNVCDCTLMSMRPELFYCDFLLPFVRFILFAYLLLIVGTYNIQYCWLSRSPLYHGMRIILTQTNEETFT